MNSGKNRPDPSVFVLPARQKRTRASRDRILDAADREFALHGYHGASVADLTREASCSVGSFYRRFKDKEGLFFALQERTYKNEIATIDKFFDNPKCQTENFDTLLKRLVINSFFKMQELAGYFKAFVELSQRNAMVWQRNTDLEAHQGQRLAELVVSRGLAKMTPELVEKATLATRTVNGFLITYVLYQPQNFPPTEPFVTERLSGIFCDFMDLPVIRS